MSAIDQFAVRAEAFRCWLIEGTDTGAAAVQQALSHLTGLFGAALGLPTGASANEAPRVTDDEWRQAFEACRRLPVRSYGVVFDPLIVPPGETDITDVADDLADIYRDIVTGLRAYQNGDHGEAAWQWRFAFWSHWGRHAIGAMGALRAWLEADGTGY